MPRFKLFDGEGCAPFSLANRYSASASTRSRPPDLAR
jgi:hypothetical protein